jgi:hypothetical protein
VADLTGPNPDEVNGLDARGVAVTAKPVLMGARGSTATPSAVSDGQAVDIWASQIGALNVILRDTSGAYVTPTGGSGGIAYVDAVAWTTGVSSFDPIGGVFNDAAAALTSGQQGTVRLTADRGLVVEGNIAHDGVDAGYPLKIGGYAKATAPTAVSTAADRVNAWFGLNGQMAVTLVDLSGNVVTPGGGTTYTEDAALGAVGSALGPLHIARASTAAPTSVSADADAVGLWASRFGALNVILRDTSGAAVPTGTQYAEDTALGTPTGTAIILHASTAVPTAMSTDGDAVSAWANRSGAQVVGAAPHVLLVGSPWTLTSKTAQYTSAQTSTDLIAAVAGTTIVITSIQIQAGGTTAGAAQVYFGTGAFSRGTSKGVFDGEFAPSATLKPGVVMKGPFISAAADALKVTTAAAINPFTVTVWYYVVT